MRSTHPHARALASRLLDECGVTEPEHIRIETIAAVKLSWKPPIKILCGRVDGAAAQLVRVRDSATILLSDRITDPLDRTFHIAHEIGHLVCGHPMRSLAVLTNAALQDDEFREQEGEANAFASELLMPSPLVGRECDLAVVDLEGPRRLARRFSVAVATSAIRFTELTPAPCAAVFSVAGDIQWYARSRAFKFARRRSLHPVTDAHRFHLSGTLDGNRRSIRASAWIATSVDSEVSEHCVRTHLPDSVVTLVSIPVETARLLN